MQVPAPQTFLQQVEGIFILFLGPVMLAAGSYIVWKLNDLRTAQSAHNVQSSAKLNAIVAATPGATAALAAAPPVTPKP
jgi:hypothetical protein